MTKINFKPALLAAAVAAAAFAAQAQQNAPQAPASSAAPNATMQQQQQPQQQRASGGGEHDGQQRMQRRVERMQVRIAQRLAALKVKLQLTPAQQGAWSTFEKAVQPTPDQLQRMASMRSQMRDLTTPERIDRMRSMRAERDAAMDKVFDATKTFYAQLSSEQQKTFDRAAMHAWGEEGGGKGRHGRHQGGGGEGMWQHGEHGGRS